MQIKSIEEKELNPSVNPRMAWDGGGYHQPEYTISFDDGSTLVITDVSCGAFGTRVLVDYDADRTHAAYGTMFTDSQEFTDFTEEHRDMLQLVSDALGYHIPYNLKEDQQ